MALEAAAGVARAAGFAAHILGDAIEGEAREVGKVLAAIALQVARRGAALRAALRPAVRRRDDGHRQRLGRGGRNVEFLLSLGLALRGASARLRDRRRH